MLGLLAEHLNRQRLKRACVACDAGCAGAHPTLSWLESFVQAGADAASMASWHTWVRVE